MVFSDRTLVCRDCGAEFLFSAREQEFFAEKGFQNDPSRCPSCRAARKQRTQGNEGYRPAQRQLYEAVCDDCGVTTQVPFQPSGTKPVYCRECFQNIRNR
ncbi:zinc-ribbon domain containing protein [Desulforamulus aquiferis]|uniref:Zinc-ribbon domain containing protein n=1 Tax=Desulforamulus aquiferis TaxID=1397668 RepID=A0AAW7Z5I4_9FIRM|nr:zinc-ribbon domain containing protein [Desulforamulus aquiferis]MDO7785633.1 zinc-ribbon domain containing protein [Desulforamulus aquiferis]RYD03219.1 zinc-binding protein [Desulforamulus aquiferis]